MKTQPNPVYFSDPTGLAGQGGCSWCNPVAPTFDREIMDTGSASQPQIGSLFDIYTGGSFTGGWGRGYGRLGLSDRGFARADAFFGQKNAEAVAGEFLKKNGLEFKDENGAPIEIGAGTLFTIGVVGLGDGNGNITKVLGYRIYADEGFQLQQQTHGDPGLRLLASTTLVKDGDFKTESGDFKFLGGQHVRIELTNMNVLGVQIDLADQSRYYMKKTWLGAERKVYSGDSHSLLLLPGQTKSYDFYRFDYSPMLWQFGLDSQISDAVNVRVRIYSTWIPGDPIDPNHPNKNQLGPK